MRGAESAPRRGLARRHASRLHAPAVLSARGRGAAGPARAVARIKAASFDDRMTLVEHLDELRSRLIFCGVALLLVAVVCFWQNQALLDIANEPLPDDGFEPITLSPTEPFLTTLTLVALQRDPDHDADPALPRLRVHPAGAQPDGEEDAAADAPDGPGAVHRRRRLRLLRRRPGRRSTSSSTSTTTQFNIQIRAREYYSLLLALADLRRRPLPDPGRGPRGHPARHRHPRSARRRTAATRSS